MNDWQKYIVTVSENGLKEEIFLFPNSVPHNVMAEAVCRLKNQLHGNNWKRIDRPVISAGFVCDGRCFGKSESLNMASRPEKDTEFLKDIIKHE